MTRTTFNGLVLVCSLSFVAFLAGCSEDDKETGGTGVTEFIADLDDFADYLTWNRVDYTVYPTNLAILGPAHASSDSSIVRMIYTGAAPNGITGEYPVGSIIVKETFGWNVSGQKDFSNGNLLAMVKRGADFNADHDGWEWFDLAPDLSAINARDANLMGGMCNGCHAAAEGYGGMDYAFQHPGEYEVPAGGEFDYFSAGPGWAQVDSSFGADPFLSGAHGDNTEYSRVVYRWQPAAKASDAEFPVGTVLLKEVYKDSLGTKIYPAAGGGWTAMVKRGGDYNPTGGDWEWFMLDPNSSSLSDRGQLAMCSSCHATAETGGGVDFVFPHPGL